MTSDPADRADCCGPTDPRIARHFDQRMRERATTGQVPETVAVSRRLRELLSDVGELRPTVLDLGSGGGALTVELLERGAAAADGVDLSPESVATAQRRASAAGVADRATFIVGDAAAVPLTAHDWVVLDRVICCYPDVDRLLASAIGAATRRFAFSLPCSKGWRGLVARMVVALDNATIRIRGRACPGYVHDIPLIEARLGAAGFARLRDARAGFWYAAVWERPGDK